MTEAISKITSPDYRRVRNDSAVIHRTGLPYNFPCPDKSGWEHRKLLKELVKSISEVSDFKV